MIDRIAEAYREDLAADRARSQAGIALWFPEICLGVLVASVVLLLGSIGAAIMDPGLGPWSLEGIGYLIFSSIVMAALSLYMTIIGFASRHRHRCDVAVRSGS